METNGTTTVGDIPDRQFHLGDGKGNIRLREGEPILAEDAAHVQSEKLVEAERTAIMKLIEEKGIQIPGERTLERLWRTVKEKWKHAA